MADLKPVAASKIGELSASLDIVIGRTPDEDPDRRRKR
jgi:hypothetical protein